MTKMEKYQGFVVDKEYTLHAQGFPEPIVGKILNIEVVEGDQVLLVIMQTDGTEVNVWFSAITGWSVNKIAA